jgi:sugar lactone lactonase YvrE
VALDGAGNLFVADTFDNRIRRVDVSTGEIGPVAGGFGGPAGLAVDGLGNLFVADWPADRIYRVDASTGAITTVAGTGREGYDGDGGPATQALLAYPVDVKVDAAGNLFVADSENDRIRRVDGSTGIIRTVVGGGTGSDGGPANQALLSDPRGVALDAAGNLYLTDALRHRVRRVNSRTGVITTVAGTGQEGYGGDGGPATQARLSEPWGIAVDEMGNVYVADSGNNRIRRIDGSTGRITTVAGTGEYGYSGDNGPATRAQIYYPTGVAVGESGIIYICDSNNSRIRAVRVTDGGGSETPTIATASYSKPILTITGSSFGDSGATVTINGRDVTARKRSQNEVEIVLRGGIKKLNLRAGPNEITVTVNGQTSNIFTLNR